MRRLLLSLVGSLTLALLAACAGLGEASVSEYGSRTKPINMGFVYFADVGGDPAPGSQTSAVFWDLTVDPNPTPIMGGETFAADLQATATISETLIATGQLLLGGFKDAMLVDFQATVDVREGATGEDVVLTPDPVAIPYVCQVSKTACNPENDLPGTERVRGNTDCQQPLDPTNPCGQLVEIPWSDDCDPGGLCDDLGRTGEGSQCAENEFCVTGPVQIPLTGPLGSYRADASGSILFGFDDGPKTGFEELEEGGCNDGTWYSELPAFEDDLGSNGMRVLIGGIPVALEFIMGEECRGPYGIDCCDPAASPTPDYRLIRFPIHPAP